MGAVSSSASYVPLLFEQFFAGNTSQRGWQGGCGEPVGSTRVRPSGIRTEELSYCIAFIYMDRKSP